MEKNTYDIVFNLKNNPSGALREINKLMVDIQGSTQKMTTLMSQQLSMMQNPIDEARNNWLNLTGMAGAYFAVISENTAGVASLIEIRRYLGDIGVTTKVTSVAQNIYNKTVLLGQKAINAYMMQVLTARTAISSTTGVTKALNIALAASPWILGATLIAGAAVAIYKFCSGSDEATKAQGRLNGIMTTLNKEVATERLTLDNLFTPLNKAREGTEEWQKAKNNIVAKYGGYLDKMGIEITNADTARKAYDKLSEAIINSARARAMESATAGAADVYTGKEAETIKNIRERLYGNIGSGDGKISSQEAGKAMGQIMLAVRSGKNIPKEARDILSKLETVWTDPEGFAHRDNFVANYIYQSISDIRKAKENYEKELATAKVMFGGGQDLLSTSNAETNTNDTTNGTVTIEPRVELESAEGSLAALEAKLSDLRERQRKAPLEAIVTFSVDIANLQSDIASAQSIINKTNFQAAHPVKPTDLDAAPVGGRYITTGSLDINSKDHKSGLKDMKLEPMNFDIQDPLTGMERWNEAVGLAREKNQELTDNMGAMGNAMGNVGNLIGGAAGEWLQWGANAVQAIGQAIPQVLALLGIQSTQATANTTVAATGAAASMSSIPIVGPILAIAAVASVLAALANLPKFAYGGIAYGPTLGLFGEYSGAINNPEVVAPLNRLRQLIQPADGGNGGKVVFRIEGRTLVGILERENNLIRRS
ncbi:hypothetical protein [Bacteroides cellulosilyticus]|uniref:Phage tail tape measure protein n=2 Tax=Bacteroidaceae TaxID=815 RepID=A0AAW8VJX9_9BACE|nr:hypothetical protein [Bacteroides cellulosilyticus]MDT4512416.1 hypothetical protein [Bacteroides cellulosilyticus]